jgi:hypothetical protein
MSYTGLTYTLITYAVKHLVGDLLALKPIAIGSPMFRPSTSWPSAGPLQHPSFHNSQDGHFVFFHLPNQVIILQR